MRQALAPRNGEDPDPREAQDGRALLVIVFEMPEGQRPLRGLREARANRRIAPEGARS